MKRLLCLFFVAMALSGCHRSAIDVALESLDATIADREAIEDGFEARLLSWKEAIGNSDETSEKFILCDSLYHAYKAYDLDSAYRYLGLKMDFALESGSRENELRTLLDESVLKDVKLLDESIRAFDKVLEAEEDVAQYGLETLRDYCGYSLYSYAASVRPLNKDLYLALSRDFGERFLQSDSLSVNSAIARSKIMASSGKDAEIPSFLESFLQGNVTEDEKASLYYNSALAWERAGDADNALLCFIKSAEADFRRPARKYISLSKTAEYLVDRGDNVRASRYIRIAADDILSSKSLSILSSTASCMLNISEAMSKVEKRQNRTAWLIVIITAFSALVMTLLFLKARKQSQNIERLNGSLSKVNSELEVSNKIRTNYLGTYMIKCAEYIGKVDENVHTLRKIYAEKGADALHSQLRNSSYSEEEYERFYREFNDTFLRVFPGFIAKVNEIMQPGFEFSPDPQKPLPMELRILEAYRLGLTESRDIARFLNCALTTVYTYRTRTKRHSKLSGKEFDDYIMGINI